MDGQVDRMTPGVSCNMSHVHGVERADIYPASQSQTSYKQLSQTQQSNETGAHSHLVT